ncbi:hypothetical protein Clacol_004780 [Clathrus columnatus]|uniref:Ribosome biogenesis regulatory protein n=1 Tax=Clathrus columnatus TaxID=1419009 RepID=A0AAV5ABL1_9AGAM|nr:hypothetical protein Clacol_004780 [Clathrus columnatus]
MDVSSIIASEQTKQKSITVEKEIPVEVDPGLLTVTDLNLLDYDTYKQNLEEFLRSTARDGCQILVTSLFSLPVESTPEGPLAKLPEPQTQLPRSKPLPKPKAVTKWEKFAAAKGIQKTKRDKKVFDEEKQEWLNRWGRDGKNREVEQQWLTELPNNAGTVSGLFHLHLSRTEFLFYLDVDYDPIKASREERKNRIAKNEKQRMRNIEHADRAQATPAEDRKRTIEKTLAVSRMSTASMGKFEKHLDGEKKLQGVKRKATEQERKSALAIASKLDGSSKKPKPGGDDVLNVRKAIRSLSKGKGSSALVRNSQKGKPTARGKAKAKR